MTDHSQSRVYVLETGCYEDRSIEGVYATPGAAMAAWHPTPPEPRMLPGKVVYDSTTSEITRAPERPATTHTYTWTRRDWGWYFDGDWDDAADITEHEVQT